MFQDRKNIGAGLIFILIALFFGVDSLTNLRLGTASDMGPGFFPLLVAVVLLLLGLAILGQAFAKVPSRLGTIPWRALPPILFAPVAFGLLVRPLGLGPALFLSLVISFAASRKAGWGLALGLSAGLAVFCLLVFVYGLGLPISALGSALGG